MYGAILGDIIGSPFEFDRGDKTKNFDLFSEGCGFTDDSVMTIAVGEALMAVGPKAAVKEIEEAVASNMQDWGKRYPHAGYGGSFRHWLKENNPKQDSLCSMLIHLYRICTQQMMEIQRCSILKMRQLHFHHLHMSRK